MCHLAFVSSRIYEALECIPVTKNFPILLVILLSGITAGSILSTEASTRSPTITTKSDQNKREEFYRFPAIVSLNMNHE